MLFGYGAKKRWGKYVPNGLAWVDGVARHDKTRQLEVISVDSNGHHRASMPVRAGLALPLTDDRAAWMTKAHQVMRKVEIADLAWAERLFDPRDVLNELFPGIQPSRRHALFQVSRDPKVFVPAILLISALYARSKVLDQYLLTPNGAELLGVAEATDDAINVYFAPGLKSYGAMGRLARIVAWLNTCSDAKRSHASVLHHFQRGEIDLFLPSISLSFWASCLHLETGCLAYELGAIDIRYPVGSDNIRLHVGKAIKEYPAYLPARESPWSRKKKLSARAEQVETKHSTRSMWQ